MRKYTINDIGKILLSSPYIEDVIDFACANGFSDTDVDYSEDNYGYGDYAAWVDEESEEAEGLVLLRRFEAALDYLAENLCEKEVWLDHGDNGLVVEARR